MSHELRLFDLSYEAAADYYTTSKQFFVMKLNTSGRAELSGAAAASMIGILQNKPKQYEAAEVRNLGLSKAVCGDTIACGAKVTADANGAIVTATAGQKYCGTAQEAGADGRVITILMEHGYMPAA
jgi:hypothetical protein